MLAYLYGMDPQAQDRQVIWDYAVLIDDADKVWMKVVTRTLGD